jgi:xanthine dehydrogenase accessory factor
VIGDALTRRAQELAAKDTPFVVATVVRVQRPASVEPGNVGLVHADGTIEGFIGGVCAQHSVRLHSLEAIESGIPLLLRILPDGPEEIVREEGAVTVTNPCLSGGAIEVFLDPVLPAPRVLVAGDSPIVAALRRLGPEVGLRMVAAQDIPDGTSRSSSQPTETTRWRRFALASRRASATWASWPAESAARRWSVSCATKGSRRT